MASRRYRRNNNVGTRLVGLEADAIDNKKEAGLSSNEVKPNNLIENAVERRAIAPNAVGAAEIDRGAVGTEHLGVVNEIKTDTPLVLSGTSYTPTPGGQALVLNSFGQVVTGAPGGLGNKVINGAFRQNQRAITTGTTLAAGEYGFDRWQCPGVTNMAMNPRAYAATTGWSGSGASISRLTGLTIPGLSGVTTAIRATMSATTGGPYLTSDATAPYTLITPGRTYRISAWLRASVAKTVTPAAQFFTAAGVNNSSVTSTTPIALAANTWTLVEWDCYVSSNASARMGPYWYSTTAWAAGNTIDITGLLIYRVDDFSSAISFFDGHYTDSSWAGTANASYSYSVPAVPTLTFTANAQFGQEVTISADGRLRQYIERNDVPAGNYTFAHDGTALVRAYVYGTTPPPFVQGPVTVAADGSSGLFVEFLADGISMTVSHARVSVGNTDLGFTLPHYRDEVRDVQRFFVKIGQDGSSKAHFGTGAATTTTAAVMFIDMPTQMRRTPIFSRYTGTFLAGIHGLSNTTVTGMIHELDRANTRYGAIRIQASAMTAITTYGLFCDNAAGTNSLEFDAEVYLS